MGRLAGLTAIAKLAAKVGNVGQARAALGAVSETVAKAYQRLPGVSSVEGIRANFQDRLDRLNTTAQNLYANFLGYDDAELLAEGITDKHAMQIGWCLSTANELFNDIQAEDGVTYFGFEAILTDALTQAGTWVGQGVDAVAKPLAAGTAALIRGLWVYIVIAAAIGLAWLFRARIVRAVQKRAA